MASMTPMTPCDPLSLLRATRDALSPRSRASSRDGLFEVVLTAAGERLTRPLSEETLSALAGSRDPVVTGRFSRIAGATEGSLAARFESGEAGTSAIGFDAAGGTSYGVYQIASRPGTMSAFLEYLDRVNPDWAARLRAAGPADTGSRSGAMPDEWRRIAAEDPEGFAGVQREFIQRTHVEPARQAILEKTGIDVAGRSDALVEVLWSTAVQHGAAGAAAIFTSALNLAEPHPVSDRDWITAIYAERGRRTGNLSGDLARSLQHRFQRESADAVSLLDNGAAV